MLRVNEIYKEKYGETLRNMIDGELAGFFGSSSHFKYFMQLLLTPTDQVDAELLDDSMRGWGTDETLLTELCVTRTNAEIRAMKARFLQMNGKPVSSWVTSETSSSYQRFLMFCLDGDRNEGYEDEEEAEEDAKKLYNAGLNGSDELNEKKIFKIITRASVEQIGLIKKAYKNKYETDLISAICDVFDSDLEKAMVARCTKKHQYYANVLDNAWKGLGTDEKATSRVFARANKSDIKKIAKAYKNQTGNDFRSQIESETSGTYKEALIAYLYSESPSVD
jgi:annexin A7/11